MEAWLPRKLTILIPALNEEKVIELTASSLFTVAQSVLDEVQVIVVNDGSTDSTGAIIDQLALKNPAFVAIHHPQPKGLAYIFQEGVANAKFDYLTSIPGDNAYNAESLKPFFAAVGSADMILGYRTNQWQARKLHRVIISVLYNWLMKLLFLSPVRDFHGPVVSPVTILRTLPPSNAISQVDFIIKLQRKRLTYRQVPVRLNSDKEGRSRALRWSTFVSVREMLMQLLLKRDDS